MTSVIIIGAGAAGLMCAATAAARGRSVTVLEHQGQPGRKILVSGGGRCNFTNLEVGPGNYLSSNPHFAKSALARYSPYDFMQMMTRHHLTWNEKTLGQLFCDQRAEAVLKMLQRE
jgi:predicted flavoprotein YhiN